jgi:hypothetical protein
MSLTQLGCPTAAFQLVVCQVDGLSGVAVELCGCSLDCNAYSQYTYCYRNHGYPSRSDFSDSGRQPRLSINTAGLEMLQQYAF